MTKSNVLPGKFKLSDRANAPFVGYWPFSAHQHKSTVFSNLRLAYDAALAGAQHFQEHMDKLRKDETLSEKGIKQAAAKYVAEQGLPRLAKNKLEATAGVRRDVKARLAKMSPVEIDRSDLFAEMQRREMRDALRAMPKQEAIRIVERGDNETLIDAILSAPPMLSGLPESVLQMATERRLDQRYGDELKVLGEVIEAAEIVERAFDGVRAELRDGSGMPLHEFAQISESLDQAAVDAFKPKFEKERPNETLIPNFADLVKLPKGAPDDVDIEKLGSMLARPAA